MSSKLSIIAAGLLATLSLSAFAGHNGGGGPMGGMSVQHMSSQGMSNTNGIAAVDRDKGLARAEERRNAQAGTHERADAAQDSHKTSWPEKHKSH